MSMQGYLKAVSKLPTVQPLCGAHVPNPISQIMQLWGPPQQVMLGQEVAWSLYSCVASPASHVWVH